MRATTRFPRGLYGITPDWPDTERLLTAIREAAQGGMKALQWRRKSGEADERLAQAREVGQLCKQLGLVYIVNDSVETALEVDADGVHLGRDDGSWLKARRQLGPIKLLGCSCYNELDLANEALEAGADYIAFGAVYPSTVKPEAVKASLDHIRQGRKLADQLWPEAAVVAIGGIHAENALPVVRAGADSIAVISGIFESSDIRAAAAACAAVFTDTV